MPTYEQCQRAYDNMTPDEDPCYDCEREDCKGCKYKEGEQ